jgi:hypothetical protein
MAIKKKEAPFQPSGEVSRLVLCDKGNWAYLFDLRGRTHHLKTTDETFFNIAFELNEASGGKIVRDLRDVFPTMHSVLDENISRILERLTSVR